MFTLSVRTHMMIAHSLPDPFFGPAAQLHGATYVADFEFRSPQLDAHNVVIDIGVADTIAKQVMDKLNYRNLDELPQMRGVLTTTEYLARYVHNEVSEGLRGRFEGHLKVTLHESHLASASYEARVS